MAVQITPGGLVSVPDSPLPFNIPTSPKPRPRSRSGGGGGGGSSRRSTPPAPTQVSATVDGFTVIINGQGYSVPIEQQKQFIQDQISRLGGVASPTTLSTLKSIDQAIAQQKSASAAAQKAAYQERQKELITNIKIKQAQEIQQIKRSPLTIGYIEEDTSNKKIKRYIGEKFYEVEEAALDITDFSSVFGGSARSTDERPVDLKFVSGTGKETIVEEPFSYRDIGTGVLDLNKEIEMKSEQAFVRDEFKLDQDVRNAQFIINKYADTLEKEDIKQSENLQRLVDQGKISIDEANRIQEESRIKRDNRLSNVINNQQNKLNKKSMKLDAERNKEIQKFIEEKTSISDKGIINKIRRFSAGQKEREESLLSGNVGGFFGLGAVATGFAAEPFIRTGEFAGALVTDPLTTVFGIPRGIVETGVGLRREFAEDPSIGRAALIGAKGVREVAFAKFLSEPSSAGKSVIKSIDTLSKTSKKLSKVSTNVIKKIGDDFKTIAKDKRAKSGGKTKQKQVSKEKVESSKKALQKLQKKIAETSTLNEQLKILSDIRKQLTTKDAIDGFKKFVKDELVDKEILKQDIIEVKSDGTIIQRQRPTRIIQEFSEPRRNVPIPKSPINSLFIGSAISTSTLSKQKSKQETKTIPKTTTRTATSLLTGSVSDTTTLSKSLTGTSTVSSTITSLTSPTTTTTSVISANTFGFRPVRTIKKPKPKPPIPIPPVQKREEEKGKKKVQGFIPQVKVGRKFVNISKKPLPRTKAIGLAMRVADNTTAKTIKVLPTKSKVKPLKKEDKTYNMLKQKFRTFQQKKGSKVKLQQNKFIEKRKYAIDTPGEKSRLGALSFIGKKRSTVAKNRSNLKNLFGM